MSKITEEQLNSSGAKAFQSVPSKVRGLLTQKKAQEFANTTMKVIVFTSLKHKLAFFSDDVLFGKGTLPSEFTSAIYRLPFTIEPREGFEDGMVKNIDELAKLYLWRYEIIQSVEDLVTELNKKT
jgi:hypothetical protein